MAVVFFPLCKKIKPFEIFNNAFFPQLVLIGPKILPVMTQSPERVNVQRTLFAYSFLVFLVLLKIMKCGFAIRCIDLALQLVLCFSWVSWKDPKISKES